MVSADPKHAIIRKQVDSVTFGFYTDDDVRARAVMEITSPQAFDALGTPLPRGLYDPHLGPFEQFGGPPFCITCACPYATCPGHAGVIELCVPLYHPILFPIMVKLLRVKCLACHKFRADNMPMEIVKCKFYLASCGRLQEALDLDQLLAHQSKSTKGLKLSNFHQEEDVAVPTTSHSEAIEAILMEKQEYGTATAANERRAFTETSYEREYKRNLVKEFFGLCMGAKKCPHCGAFSPKIRQDESNKIFQAKLNATSARINAAEGITLDPALGNNDDDGANDCEVNDEPQENDGAISTAGRDNFMHALEVEAQVRRTWETDPVMCHYVFGGSPEDGYRLFFLRAIPVPPSRFRPPMRMGSMTVENSQNLHMNQLLVGNDRIRTFMTTGEQARAVSTWIEMQTTLNVHFDSSKDPRAGGSMNNGIRQILEKKEGIFRKHMMGKRVDYCCRSVISPDPYIGTDEIGIPLYFAKTLTFPTPVSNLNIIEMRELIRRGPERYPGAVWVQFADGRRVDLAKMDETKREGVAARLLTLLKRGGVPPIVGRQLRNGDMVLANRQPTLHKPGIMAHSVRVLHSKTQKTIRMHYANCNTYNADFDGDEMNCHFPQNFLAAAESKYIAATDLQYIVPTDGSPLRGLIQDHVDAGVKMTCKDTFIEKWMYQQLLFNALASLPGLEVIRKDQEIELMPPAILKPKPLWTGKQVITTLLNHLRKGNDRDDVVERVAEMPGISVERKAKLSAAGFGEEQQEHMVLIRDGELLRGVLDKAAFGDSEFSLVHAVYEAYGPHKAGLLLNSLGRLFTAYLQHYSGHSCRMEDLLLTSEADDERKVLIQRAYNIGSRSAKAWADSEGGKVQIESVVENEGAEQPLKPVESAGAAAKIGKLLSGAEGSSNFAQLDGYMQSQLNPLASDIIKACLPKGLAVPFPANTFSLMVTTGAKGSIVNQSQISCALGQQALEGRRVPRLSSGRTLPSFAPYDPSPRADGFILDRFLTGIRPQEYYFHCMAGREGLVDTAVKTSRSGYLQRCLVKHLEELKVCYDSTVRNGEGGVVQFLYGEDGLDPTKCAYLDCESTTFEYIARNHESLTRRNKALPDATISTADDDSRRLAAVRSESDDLLRVGSFVQARRLRVGSRWVRGTLCRGWFDGIIIKCNDDESFNIKYIRDGKVAENVPLQVNLGRCGGRATPAASNLCTVIKPAVPDPILSGARREDGVHRLGSGGKCVSERVARAAADAFKNDEEVKIAMKANNLSLEQMSTLVASKYGAAMCHPGEAVGCIAAQSLGEPSTQMTLNTFHLAGAGANVTLGIPRLREIIMSASRNLKTPTMSVPLHDEVTEKQALKLTRYFSKLTLMELIASHKGILVNEALVQGDGGNWERAYYVTLKFHPAERIREAFGMSLDDIARAISHSFGPKISEIMKKELRRSAQEGDMVSFEVQGGHVSDYVEGGGGKRAGKNGSGGNSGPDELEEDDDDDGAEDVAGEEDGVTSRRLGHTDEVQGYDEGDDDDEAREVAPGDEESEVETEDENGSTSEGLDGEESVGNVRAVANMSDHPKVDVRNNCIHLPALRVDPAARPLLMVGLVERAASAILVRSRPKIDQGFVNDEDDRGRCLQTAGVNFSEIWRLDNVDHNRLTSNDIWEIRCAYGVEAARNNIVDQIKAVFKPYGISVDHRHLSLIADYMTFDGGYKAMNRGGMADISSPFLQMSFETTANFMTEAALYGRKEPMMSPSASIVVGRPIRHGTGAFDLLAL